MARHGRSHQCLECESLRSTRELVGAKATVRRFFTAAGVLLVINAVIEIPSAVMIVACLLVAVISRSAEGYASRNEK